jgi:hypothetical protein
LVPLLTALILCDSNPHNRMTVRIVAFDFSKHVQNTAQKMPKGSMAPPFFRAAPSLKMWPANALNSRNLL